MFAVICNRFSVAAAAEEGHFYFQPINISHLCWCEPTQPHRRDPILATQKEAVHLFGSISFWAYSRPFHLVPLTK